MHSDNYFDLVTRFHGYPVHIDGNIPPEDVYVMDHLGEPALVIGVPRSKRWFWDNERMLVGLIATFERMTGVRHA